MTSAARQLAIVRRAAFGELPDGEPPYVPPITGMEVTEMREWLSFSHALHQPSPDPAWDAFGIALKAALRRVSEGVPVDEAGVPTTPDLVEYSEDLEGERVRMLRAFALAQAPSDALR